MNQLFKQVAWKAQIKMAALFAVGLFLSSCYTVTEVQDFGDVRIVKMRYCGKTIYIHDYNKELREYVIYTHKQLRNSISE